MYSLVDELRRVLSTIERIRIGRTVGGLSSPHKYLMLLSLIKIIEENPLHENKFTFEELEPVFNELGEKYFGGHNILPKLEYPFYHLQSDDIWTLKLKDGMEKRFSEYEETRLTKRRLLETVEYAVLSDDFFSVFNNPENRKIVKEKLDSFLNLSDVDLGDIGLGKENVFTHDFVNYLNTLSNSNANNENAIAEINVLHPLFERIRVNNPITEEVWDQLQKGNNVILTGNAGDGKTMIAAEILDKFGKVSLISQKSIELPEENLVIVKDMSELSEDERKSLWNNIINSIQTRYLIVTNTGALLSSMQGIDLPWKKTDILEALASEGPWPLTKNLVLINIGRIDSIDTALQVFEKMLKKENWDSCSTCNSREKCSIYFNVALMQSNLPRLKERLRVLYKRVFYYGQRLTMRQMTAHLAYAITGGHACDEMRKRLELEKNGLFYNWIFGDDGFEEIPAAQQLQGVRALKEGGMGLRSHPVLEADIWENGKLGLFDTIQVRNLVQEIINEASQKEPSNAWSYRTQVRRIIYFLADEHERNVHDFLSLFLDSPAVLEYLALIQQEKLSSYEKDRLLQPILQVLQEIFSGIRLPQSKAMTLKEVYIPLSVPYLVSKCQYIMARLNTDDFDLQVKEKYKAGRLVNKVLRLSYKKFDDCCIDLDLPFLDYVKRRYAGEISSQLSAHYGNRLAALKARLIRRLADGEDSDIRLLRIEKDRSLTLLKIGVSDGDEKLEVSL